MSQKEFTVFVIDVSPEMRRLRPDDNLPHSSTQKTYLQHGLAYLYDHCSNLILKNRKLDRIAFVLDDSTVLYEEGQFTYANFKEYNAKINERASSSTEEEGGGDLLDAVTAGLELFKPKIKLKYLRHLVIITNGKSDTNFNRNIDELTSFINDNDIQVVLDAIDFPDTPTPTTVSWTRIFKTWRNSHIIDSVSINNTAQYSTPLKKVGPRANFTGPLRFGIDIETLASSEDYNPATDPSVLSIQVQSYPATRVEKPVPGHEYVISTTGKSVNGLKRNTTHYIKKYKKNTTETEEPDFVDDSSEGEDFDKVDIAPGDYVPGFKYSKRDIIAVNKDLSEISQLPTKAGIDVLGFVKREHLPYAYYIDETSYVIPPQDSSSVNSVSFSSFVRALIDMEGIALARFVPNDNYDIQVCALLPQLFEAGDAYLHGFVLARLAFKEDEKIGRFPSLTKIYDSNVDEEDEDDPDDDEIKVEDDTSENPTFTKRILPTSNINNLMESFINSKDLDTDQRLASKDKSATLSNQKINLTDTEFLNLPKQLADNTDSKLLASSPALQKQATYLKKIISKSLDKESLFEFLNEDKFVENYLVDKDSTNLFNLTNILRGNTTTSKDWLSKINGKSTKIAAQLVEELGVRYLKKSATGKKKRKYSDTTYEEFFKKDGQEDKDNKFDAYFDINDILS